MRREEYFPAAFYFYIIITQILYIYNFVRLFSIGHYYSN